MPEFDQDLIGTKDAADILDESVKNTTRRAQSGELPFVQKMPGLRGAYIFDRTVVQKFADEKASALAAAPEVAS